MNAFSRMLAITLKECKQLARDRMTFAMIIMIPLVQLLLFGFAINTNVRNIPVGVVDLAQTSFSRYVQGALSATQVVRFEQHYPELTAARRALTAGEVRAVLILEADLAQRMSRSPRVVPSSTSRAARPLGQWLVDGSDTLIAAAIKGLGNMPIEDPSGATRATPRTPTFEVALFFNPEQRSVVNTVPGLVAVILTMTMVLFTSTAIVREHERGNMEFLITTPMRPIELMLGKIAPYIVIGLVQCSLILALGYWVFQVPINGSLTQIFIATVLFISASLTLGLIISTLAHSQLQAMQMTVFVLLPSILLSGFMFPFEAMPTAAQWIAESLPATHFIRLIRAIVLRDGDVWQLPKDALYLCLFTLIGLTIASFKFRKTLN